MKLFQLLLKAGFPLLPVLCLLLPSLGVAATPPDTIIRSQAEASFTDEFNEQYLVTSNEVVTRVVEVTGVRLESAQKRWGINGKELVFPHLLTNAGNIPTDYLLEISATPLNTQKPPNVKTTLYYDRDHDGQPKAGNEVPEGKRISLPPGENVSLLIKTTVPDIDYTAVVISARADRPECKNVSETSASTQGRCLAVNRNTMSRSRGVVYEVSQSTDKKAAYIGDAVQTRLSFIRKDNFSYISYVAIDYALPAELEYVEGSSQLCKYNGKSCREFKDKNIAFIENGLRYYLEEDEDQVGSPESRHEGQIHFKTRVKAGVGETLYNVAEYTFRVVGQDLDQGVRQTTNYIPLEIKGYGISLNSSSLSSESHIGEPQIVASAPAGGEVEFTNYLWNRGTEPNSYEVTLETKDNTFPDESTYCLTKNEKCTTSFSKQPPALVFNEGEIPPGTNKEIRLFIQLPDTDFAPQPNYNLTLKAVDTSQASSYEVTDTTRNMLAEITGSATNSMDLTFGEALNKGGLGAGKGPETTPLKTLQGKPGTTLTIEKIYINNTGDQADNYQLAIFSEPDSALPKSFKWSFMNEHNRPIANSVTVPAGASAQIKVLIELPANNPPERWSFYVHAHSSVTKAEDKLHLALEVQEVPDKEQLTLTPDRQAQVTPGSFVTFAHQLTNRGNTPIDNITLTVTNSRGSEGWQAMIYADSDDDGQITAGESIIDLTKLLSLDTGKNKGLIIKLFAPANAPQGETNITTLTATWGNKQSLTVTDTSQVNSTNVMITKLQAHWNCEKPLPTDFSRDGFKVIPNECVVYKLTASNHGVETANSVMIHDRAPSFTQFEETSGLPFTETGGKREYQPNLISGSTITATWPQLTPGASVSLVYGIRIQ